MRLNEHEEITRHIITRTSGPFEWLQKDDLLERVVRANMREDHNYLVKGLFSHFYNPSQTFWSLWRVNNQIRVKWLSRFAARSYYKENHIRLAATLGRIIHHFQDMTIPVHVIPINHSMFDTFERYPLHWNELLEYVPQPVDLPDGTQLMDIPTILHHWVAAKTLKLCQGTVDATDMNGKAVQVPLSKLWKEGSRRTGGWGEYGVLGNVFGQATIGPQRLCVHPDEWKNLRHFTVLRGMDAIWTLLHAFSLDTRDTAGM
jgi:hypothetical protein